MLPSGRYGAGHVPSSRTGGCPGARKAAALMRCCVMSGGGFGRRWTTPEAPFRPKREGATDMWKPRRTPQGHGTKPGPPMAIPDHKCRPLRPQTPHLYATRYRRPTVLIRSRRRALRRLPPSTPHPRPSFGGPQRGRWSAVPDGEQRRWREGRGAMGLAHRRSPLTTEVLSAHIPASLRSGTAWI